MKILDRYIRRIVLSSTIIVTIVLVGVEGLAELITQLSSVGKANYTVLKVLLYVPMQLPAVLYMAFPIAGFIGCLIGMGRLASANELTVMRANGVSVAQITWSVVKTALLMIIVVTFIGELVAPRLQAAANKMQAHALNKSENLLVNGQVWLKHHNRYIYINRINNAHHMQDISEFSFHGMQLKQAIYAKTAEKINGHWQLNDVVKTIFLPGHTVTRHLKSSWFGIHLAPNKLHNFEDMSLQGSLYDLWQIIHVRQSAGLVASLFQLTFWQRVIQPLTTIVVICLGIPFVFGSLRSVSTSVRLIAGVALGFTLYMFNRFFGPIVLIYQFPPWLAAVLPTLILFIIYMMMLRRKA